jgi:hypothetical protein
MMALDDEWEVVSEEPLAAADDPWAVVSEEPVAAPRPRLSDPGPRAGRQPGLRVQGNIDTRNLPQVPNADGSVSTVRSMSFQDDQGREVLVPTVNDGRVMSDDEAVAEYQRTGRHLGMFDTPENATSFAQRLHEDQARRISQPSPHTVGETAAAYAGSRPQMPGVPGGGFFESLAEQLSMPSFADVYQSLGATLARTVQGTKLQALENEKAKLLGRVTSGGIQHYMTSPEYLRGMSDDPRIIELDRLIAEEKAIAPEITADEQEIAARNPGLLARGTIGAANSIALAAPSLAYALTTRDPKGAAALAGIPTGATSYSGYREAGLTDARAARHALIDEAIEVGTEYLPIKAVLKPGTSAFRRFINVLGAELPGESVATIGQTLNEHLATVPNDVTVDDWIAGLEKGVYQLPETWLTTIMAGGVHTGTGELIQKLAERNREAKLSADADAVKERALASAIDLTNAIRGPQGRLALDDTASPPPPPQPPAQGPDLLAQIMRQIGAPPPERAEPGIDMDLLSSVVPQDPFAPELPMRDPTIQPELPIDTIAPPDTTGSRAPDAGGSWAAPIPPLQGTASTPLSSALQQPAPAAPLATPAPQEPAPAPAPAEPAVSTAKEPPASGATDFDKVAAESLFHLENDESAPTRVYTPDPRGGLTTPDKPPPWRDIGSGWQAREFNEQLGDKTFPRQEMREPGGKRYVRGYDLEGRVLDVSPDIGTKFDQQFGDYPGRRQAERDAAAQLPGAKQMKARRDDVGRTKVEESRLRDMERLHAEVVGMAEELAHLTGSIPMDQQPNKLIDILKSGLDSYNTATHGVDALNGLRAAATAGKEAIEIMRKTKAEAAPNAPVTPKKPQLKTVAKPQQGTLFDEEATPAPAAEVKQPAPAPAAQAAPTRPTATPETAGQPADEATRDMNKTPRGGWPAAGHWIYEVNDGTLSDELFASQLFKLQDRVESGTTKDRRKMAKAVAAARIQYSRYAPLHRKVIDEKLDKPHPALAYRLQEMLTETDPKKLADLTDGLQGMLAGSVDDAKFKVKEAKRVAREMPKPKATEKEEPKPTPAQVEERPAPKGKRFELPEPPPIRTPGAKRSSKAEARLKEQTEAFHEKWAEYKQLGKQWKSDDMPAAIARENTQVGLGLQYLKQADTFLQYTGELTRINRWLDEAVSTMRSYQAPEPPNARTTDEEARAKTLDDLVRDQTTLRLRDGMRDARNDNVSPKLVSRSFWTKTFPKLGARAKEYAIELANQTSYAPQKTNADTEAEYGESVTKSLPEDNNGEMNSLGKFISFMQFASQYLSGQRELPAVRKHNRGKKKPENKYESLVPRGTPVREQADVEPLEGEVTPLPTTEEKFGEVIDDYAGLFDDPDVKVHATDHPDYTGFISEKAAKKRVLLWERQAEAQAKTHRQPNNERVIFSLFDLTLAWSQPYIDAGYTVIPLDLQTGDDILDLSVGYLHERFPDIADVYGILIAAPCTDFALAGNAHIKAKDEEGKTELSKELVFQAMRLVDYYKPQMWVLENPAYSYIEDASGLPSARYEFQPYDFGDPYMKRTQLWGKFNTDLPVAPVYPREGSKMWSQFGGKGQATKNARSETPKGFAYAFFKANNAADATPHERLIAQFPDAAGAIEKALEAGFTEQQILDTIESIYEADDAKEARTELRRLVKTGEPEGEPQELPKPVTREQTKRPKFTQSAEKEIQAKLKAERDARLGKTEPEAAEETTDEDEVVGQDEDIGEKSAKKSRKAASRSRVEGMMEPEGVERADETQGSSRFKRADERFITPSTTRENMMEALGIDPTEFRLKGGEAQWEIASKAIKDRYGYAGVYKHPRQTWRNAVDHLLDAFESLQNMAEAMGQGNKIVSLNGAVTLLMREKPGKTKGYYRHRGGLSGEKDRTIAVFNQEDVYSHELGHALDFDLMERAGGSEEPGGLSAMIRKRENTSALPTTTREAYADVMTALYYDSAAIAQLIKQAEHQLEKAGTDKRRAELEKRLKNLRSGAWTGRGSKTEFYKRAKDGPMADYLRKPTELFARAFEAYISWKVQYQQELNLVKFLGATDAIYRDEADAWIARIYPQANERQQIFSAFDNLLGQLARENLYDTKGNPGWAQSKINIGLMDPVARSPKVCRSPQRSSRLTTSRKRRRPHSPMTSSS